MENQREKANQDHRVAPAIDRLKAAISSAPIEELRAPIEEERGLKEEVDIENLRDSLDLLKDRARLAHRESIETLIEIGSDIAYFLSRIVQPADRKEGASLLEPSTESNEPEGNWRETIDESVNILLDLEAPEDNIEPHRFVTFLEELPYARNSFPLHYLLGKSEPPKGSLREIADLCDRLVQRRLDEELALVAHDLSSRSFCWPLFITAVDCQSKKLLAARTQNLELGKAVASNLGVTPRGEDTPAALVRPLLIGLEQMRSMRRSDQELEDMRRSEERNEPASLDKLIAEARERLKKVDKVKLEWENLKRDGVLSNRSRLDKFIDMALRTRREAGHEELIVEKRRRGGELEEPEIVNLFIRAACIDLPVRFGFWSLENLWMRKAALLPEFSRHEEVISQWVEAAYAYLASEHNGEFEKVEWASSINDRMESKGGFDAGLKQFLREGFETLSGKDRKN